MKAVIPAAGAGKRLNPLTKIVPKECLPVISNDGLMPAIHFTIKECIDSGIDDIIIITAANKRSIEDYTDIASEFSSASIHFIRQPRPLGLADAVLKAEKHVGNDCFTVLLGDDIVYSKTPCTKQLLNYFNKLPNKNTVLAIEKIPPDKSKSYGMVEILKSSIIPELNIVTNIIEKPPEPISEFGMIGRYVFTQRIFDAIKKTYPDKNGEVQLTDAIKILMESEMVWALEYEGVRFDIGGSPKNWLLANLEIAKLQGALP